MKWSMPTVYRMGDKPAAGLFIFSQQDNEPVALVTKFAGAEMRQTLTLHKGANYISLTQNIQQSGLLSAELQQNGQVQDSISTKLSFVDNRWPVEQQKNVMLGGGDNALMLPEQASNIRLQSSETPQEIFRNNLDALVDEPWGGVINTGSRLIPLSLARRSLADHQSAAANDIRQMIQDNRLRLMQLAGPERALRWGEDGNGDAFLTAWHGTPTGRPASARRNAATGILATYARQLCRAGGQHAVIASGAGAGVGTGDESAVQNVVERVG